MAVGYLSLSFRMLILNYSFISDTCLRLRLNVVGSGICTRFFFMNTEFTSDWHKHDLYLVNGEILLPYGV